MYGAPNVGYGTEVVQSFNALIDAIKRRQVLRPRSLFAMCLAGVDFAVKLLPNGFVEVDGVVPPLTVEKEIEDALQEFGANISPVTDIDDAYVMLDAGQVDAIVYDAPTLQYYAKTRGAGKFAAVGSMFDQQYYVLRFLKGLI